jgi:molybdopterin-binding protein
MKKIVLKVENLVKYYKDHNFVLRISQLEFEEGKVYSIVGPNGAGKTTLLNLLNLLEKPDKGRIFFKNQEITNPLEVRRKMAMVMENPFFFRTTVLKNVLLGLKFRRIDKRLSYKKAKEVLKKVELDGFENRDISTLSQGEKQRVAIARALVLEPEVLFLDEPFTNVDKKNINKIEELIESTNGTVIFTTHNFRQAYRLSHKLISLFEGKITPYGVENLFSGEVEEIGGSKFIKISPSVKVSVITEKKGKVHISVPPQDIILSLHPFQSSARNSFGGIIKEIYLNTQVARIVVDIGVKFVSLITIASYKKMNLSVGSKIFLTFKSTSVTVF